MATTDSYVLTYADLKQKLNKLTPAQLAMKVQWTGDERGGDVYDLWIAPEDFYAMDEGAESLSSITEQAEGEGVSVEEFIDGYKLAFTKGQPQLVVD